MRNRRAAASLHDSLQQMTQDGQLSITCGRLRHDVLLEIILQVSPDLLWNVAILESDLVEPGVLVHPPLDVISLIPEKTWQSPGMHDPVGTEVQASLKPSQPQGGGPVEAEACGSGGDVGGEASELFHSAAILPGVRGQPYPRRDNGRPSNI